MFIGFFTQLFIKGTSGALGKFHVMARYIQTSITKNMRCLEKAKAKYSNVRSIPTQASFPTAYMIQRGSVVTQVQCCSLRSDGPVLWSNCLEKPKRCGLSACKSNLNIRPFSRAGQCQTKLESANALASHQP